MKKNSYFLLLLAPIIFVTSCKKDSAPQPAQQSQIATLEKGLQTLNITGQLLPTEIDEGKKLVTIVMPHNISMQNLAVSFTLADQMIATTKDKPAISGMTMDFTKTVYLTVSSADKKSSETYVLNAVTDLFYYGLPGRLISEKSLDKSYNYYYSQFDGSPFQYINCAPAVTTMAIKWADSTFNKKPVDAREMFEPGGGNWSMRNVQDYLQYYGIRDTVLQLTNLDSMVRSNIDKNQLIILNVDIYYVQSLDNTTYHHVNKTYVAGLPGAGHCLLVKGYKETDNGFYLVVNDPWAEGKVYSPSVIPFEPIGEDRYYRDSDVIKALENWDPEIFIVAAKGKKVLL